jgi:5-hydroxyisourate hydrolase-like protein (transthyretin family)
MSAADGTTESTTIAALRSPMPTERDATPATPPKLEMIRLEDRLNPVGALTADALLDFAPNPILDLGTAGPTAPLGADSISTAPAATPATVAPSDPVLAPNQYELVLPTTTDGSPSPSADSSGGAFALFSIVPPPPAASLSGFVYVDEGENGGTRDDGVKQAGEPGIPGTTVTLFRVINGVTISASQTTTDATGFYQFPSLSPFGEYQVVEAPQPAGFLDGKDTAGTVGGVTRGVAGNENITGITLNALDAGVNYNFGELRAVQPTGALSGFVYVDEGANGGTRDDGIRQFGETPIPGTTVTLFRVVNGQTLSVSQTTTDANGFYRFANLPATGGYLVRETQPANFNDGKDTPGSTGGVNSANDELSAITVPANGESVNNNFGELIPPPQLGALSGFVYVDEGAGGGNRDDGIKDPGEAPIAGVTVSLFRVVNGVTTSLSQTTTDANGFYRFANLTPGDGYLVRETQPAGFDDGKDTAGSTGGVVTDDQIAFIAVPPNGESAQNNFGELLPPNARLSGFVYVDEGAGGGTRDDGVRQPGEPGIAGVTVSLVRVVNGVTNIVTESVTNGAGFYEFTNLPAGTYEVREGQPAGFDDGKDTPGSTGGVAPQNDRLVTIPLAFGQNSQNNNFGELLQTGALSGFVYVDEGANGGTRDDGVKQAGETPIPGATVTLFRVVNGQTTSLSQATTDAAGFYRFANLTAGGGYLVRETQPANFVDGKDTPGSTGGLNSANDVLSAISVPANGESLNNNFGELLPPTARLSGFVYEDLDNDGIKDPGEPGIAGVAVGITGVLQNGQLWPPSIALTDANGFYEFTNLPAGSYVVDETQPGAYLDGKDTPGSTGGLNSANDLLSGIPLAAGANSVNNNFGELRGSISGFVYVDEGAGGGTRDDGIKQPGEAPIANVVVRLLKDGVVQATATSGADGSYRFDRLLLGGGYTVQETAQPAGFLDGKDTAGVPGGGIAGNEVISNITLTQANPNSPNNNFGELVPPPLPAKLSGFVYVDADNDGVKDVGEAPIPGTSVTLFRVANGLTTSVSQTVTNGVGFYEFGNLPAGTYVVRETQPVRFLDGKDTPGSKGGDAGVNDQIAAVVLVPADNSVNNNFGELLPPPARLSGYVYVDTDNDGIRDPGEAPIPGTVVRIGGVTTAGVPTGILATTTDVNGFYEFTNLAPGTYGVQEVQPAGYLDGLDTPGSTGGGAPQNDTLINVPLAAGDNSINNNFGELLPPPPPPPPVGSLNGFVYQDTDDDGIKDADEAGIPGTTVRLTNGTTTLTTTTDGNGFYQFLTLTPGQYTVIETQPAKFLDGKDTPGSTGGNNAVNDVLSAVPVPAGGVSANNNFGELVAVSLYGHVWYDANENGRFDPVEIGLPGATVTITGTTAAGKTISTALAGGHPLSVTTDAFGRYAFPLLPVGNYTVVQTNTPAGYTDFREENAARLTVSSSTATQFTGVELNRHAGPLNFGKVNNNIIVVPPTPNPQNPDTTPSKVNFLGSSGTSRAVTVPPTTPGRLLPAAEAGPFNPSILGPNGPSDRPDRRIYAVGSGAGSASVVRVFDASTGGELFRVNPFETAFTGGVTTAIGDVNGDGMDDVIVGAAAGGGPRVRVFDGNTGATLYDFFAYAPNFTGGVWLASGDVNADGFDDIITGAGAGGGPHVKAISGKTGQDIYSFYAFDQSYTGGARVAVGDFNGDGFADIAAGTGAGVVSQVSTFDGRNAAALNTFSPYNSGFLGGVNLGAGDVNGDGKDEIITGAGAGGGPHVRVLNATTGASVYDFYAADTTFAGGVSVAANDLNGDGKADIITGTGPGAQARIQVFSGANLASLDNFFAFESSNKGGIYVG